MDAGRWKSACGTGLSLQESGGFFKGHDAYRFAGCAQSVFGEFLSRLPCLGGMATAFETKLEKKCRFCNKISDSGLFLIMLRQTLAEWHVWQPLFRWKRSCVRRRRDQQTEQSKKKELHGGGGVNPYKEIDLNLKKGVSIRVCKGLSEGKIGYTELENQFPFLL